MIRILSVVIVLALLLSGGVAVPVTATGEVTISINAPNTVAPGANFTATVNITQVVNFDAANFDVSFNPAILRLNNVTSGNISGNVIPVDIWNEISLETFAIVQNVPGLSGVSGFGYLAVLHFTAIGSLGTSSNITLSNGVLSSNLAQQIPATWVGDSVLIGISAPSVTITAETSIAQDKDSDGVVVVKVNIDRIKDPSTGLTVEIPGGIDSYTATVTAAPAGGIEFFDVRGVSSFGTVTFNPATGEFAVASVASPSQPANTTVAKVVPILTGNTTTSYNLIIAFQSIGAAGDPELNVPEEHSNTIILLRGDTYNDGVINITDSLALKQYLVGQLILNQINPLNAASPNHDGTGGDKITITDALAIEQKLVGQLNAYFQ